MGVIPGGGTMKLKLFAVLAALVFFFSASFVARATTYATPAPIFFPAPQPGPLCCFGSVFGTIITDGTLGPLSTQNILDFQIEVFNGTASSDVSATARSGTGSVIISGTALYATPTGVFFDFNSATSSFVKFERDSTSVGQPDTYFCLDAGGADCSGGHFDIATAVIGPGDGGLFGGFKSDLSNPFNVPGIISAAGVLQLAVGGVPEASTWAMLLIGFAGIGFVAHRRRWAL